MQTKSLQTKRALRAALLVLLLSVVGMGKSNAQNFDFSAVCSTGQTLYYKIIDVSNRYVKLTCPGVGNVWNGGNYWSGYTKPIGNINLPENVQNNGINYAIISIGEHAFDGCSGLTGDLVIPNSVITIDDWAFNKCSGFTGSLIISNSVTYIGNDAFSNCFHFGLVTIGESVKHIGNGAFERLKDVHYNAKDCMDFDFNTFGPFDGCSGTLTIGDNVESIPREMFYRANFRGNLVIPNSVISIGDWAFASCSSFTGTLTIGESVITIGSAAFYGCTGFKGDLVIPNSVIDLGMAFSGCSGFTGNLTIGNSVTTINNDTFTGCSGFKGCLTIGNSVTSIGNKAFYNLSGLTGELTIPNSVTEIGNSAFSGCSGLTSLNIGNSVTTIGYDAFSGCSGFTGDLIIPNSVTSIGGGAFYDCSGFTGNLTIPNSVTTIGYSAFYGCSGFTGNLTIGSSVEYIFENAFKGCSGLAGNLTIPNSVVEIGEYAFSGCSSFIGLTLGNSLRSVYGNSFENCSNFEQITVSEENTFFDSRNNCNAVIRSNSNLLMLGCKNTFIPNSVTIIGEEAFYSCSGLVSITIPNSVTSIRDKAFYGCSGLVYIAIPNSVTNIGQSAFCNCTSLKEINYNAKDCIKYIWNGCTEITTVSIGDSVEIVRENVFSGFGNLTTVTIGKSVRTIEKEAFANNPRLNMVYYNVEKDLVAPAPQSFNNNEYTAFYNCPNLTTIHIGPEVKEIGSNIFKGCNTVHFVVALGPTPAVLDAGAFSDIVDNSVLMVSCGKRVTYYSVWNMFPFNNIIEDCDTYGINVGAVGSGGTITPSVTEAQMGQEVQITITPNPGMVLVSIKVVNANDPTQIIPISPSGKAASTYSFTMPPFEVVVMATFKSSGASVDENNSVEVAVYPNPTNGLVKIEAESIKHITISNMLGQVVFDGKVGGDAFEYDFSGQKAGIYLVRIETANGVVVKKISVTR